MRTDAKVAILIGVVLCVPAIGYAQNAASGPRKFVIGTDFANGNFGSTDYVSTSDVSTDAYTSTSRSGYGAISPSLGMFLSDTLVVGSSVSFSFNHYKTDSSTNDVLVSTSKSHSVSLSVGPFLRKYFGNPQGRGMPFVHVEGGFGFSTYSGTYTPVTGTGYDYSEPNDSSRYFEVLAGYEMFISELLGLQYYGGYEYSWYGYDYRYKYPAGPDSTYRYTGKTNEIVFGVGLRVYLRRHK